MLRIAATMVEAFNLFHTQNWMTEDKLLGQIKRTEPLSPKAAKGIAFHEIVEKPQVCFNRYVEKSKGELGFLAKNGIAFPYEPTKKALKYINYDYPFELEFPKIYNVKGQDVLVVMRADQPQGVCIHDFKAIFSAFDYEKYSNSYQWRIYLDITGAESFQYDIFKFTETKLEFQDKIDIKPFHDYPGMDRDIQDLLTEFVDYIEFRGLQQYFIGRC